MKLDGGLYFDFELLKQTVQEEKMTLSELMILGSIITKKVQDTENTSAKEWLETNPNILGMRTKMVYGKYSTWCEKNNQLAEYKAKLGREIFLKLNLQSQVFSIKGKSVRIYTNITTI